MRQQELPSQPSSAAISAAIGGLIGGFALGGEFLASIGGFIVGGLLGGAAWLAAKNVIVALLKHLCKSTDHNVDDVTDGFVDGMSPHGAKTQRATKATSLAVV
jgi:divalent metal cation (Fe/Co/Zn/Cd) transporter